MNSFVLESKLIKILYVRKQVFITNPFLQMKKVIQKLFLNYENEGISMNIFLLFCCLEQTAGYTGRYLSLNLKMYFSFLKFSQFKITFLMFFCNYQNPDNLKRMCRVKDKSFYYHIRDYVSIELRNRLFVLNPEVGTSKLYISEI